MGQSVELDSDACNHVARVLRRRIGDEITLFNGQNLEAHCQITTVEKRHVVVKILSCSTINHESPFQIHLFQALSKGDRMEVVIQKAVELGVNQITPIITEHTIVRLDEKRLEKKMSQWQKITIAACEQSGRNTLPRINPISSYAQAISQDAAVKLILHPHHNNQAKLNQITDKVKLYIGPEGGFSDMEIDLALKNNAQTWQLGPRILRTETAAITALSVLQYQCGDLKV